MSARGDTGWSREQMAARAARIIRNLRAFARGETEPMGKVDLGAAIGQAVELTEARLRAETSAPALSATPAE